MSKQAIETIKTLRDAAGGLRAFWQRYGEKTAESRCDKYGAAFCADDRFKTFSVGNIYFSSWVGYYGNSGCTSFGPKVNNADAAKHFRAAINKLAPEIFEAMAESMESESKTLLERAEVELAQLSAIIKDVRG